MRKYSVNGKATIATWFFQSLPLIALYVLSIEGFVITHVFKDRCVYNSRATHIQRLATVLLLVLWKLSVNV